MQFSTGAVRRNSTVMCAPAVRRAVTDDGEQVALRADVLQTAATRMYGGGVFLDTLAETLNRDRDRVDSVCESLAADHTWARYQREELRVEQEPALSETQRLRRRLYD